MSAIRSLVPTREEAETLDRFEILGGPSRGDLRTQLDDIGRFQYEFQRPTVQFRVFLPKAVGLSNAAEVMVSAMIDGLHARDGSGDRWEIDATLVAPDNSESSWLHPYNRSLKLYKSDPPLYFIFLRYGFYNTKTRQGYMMLKPGGD